MICGRYSIRPSVQHRRAYATIILRARVDVEEGKKARLIVREIPFQQFRVPSGRAYADLVRGDRIKGISNIRDESV